MDTRRFPLRELMELASAAMPSTPISPHKMGIKALHDLRDAPVYVWVPQPGRASKMAPTRGVTEFRTTSAFDMSCEIYAKGKDDDQAWAMAHNLSKAIRDIVQADQVFDSVELLDPGKNHNSSGETVLCTLTLRTCFDDVYIDLTTKQAPDPSTVVINKIVGDIEKSSDVSAPGELALTVET